MKQIKIFFLLMVVLSFLLPASGVFALNRVEVKVESEGLPEGTTCSKAGGFSFEWDSGSVITVGDSVEIDLEYVNAANLMTLCRNIDILIAVNNTPIGWTNGTESTVPTTTANTAIYQIQDDADDSFMIANAPTAGIYFHIYGQAGTNDLNLVVLGDTGATITVDNGADDAFGIKFFDQRTANIYHDDADNGLAADTTYSAATVLQNTLCVNVSLWDVNVTKRSTFNANIDAVDDQWTFIPSNPQIAHLEPPTTPARFQVVGCKGVDGTIRAYPGVQAKSLFDYETTMGYCSDHQGAHRVIVESMDAPWDPIYNYTVTLEIMVKRAGTTEYVSGDNGVYWTAWNIGFVTSADLSTLCNDPDDTADNAPVGSTCQPNTNCAAMGSWTETNYSRIIQAVNIDGAATIGANHRFLWIDLPPMAYNVGTAGFSVQDGDAVQVRLSITAVDPNANTCEGDRLDLGPFDVYIGAFGSCYHFNSLVYPYFVEATATSWWSGLAIVNTDYYAGEAVVHVYEEDGEQAEVTLSVPAHDMYVNLTSGLFAEPGLVRTPADAVIGDARCYMVVCTNFRNDGFAMIGNNETGEGQGYLPRQPATSPEVCNP